MTGNASANSGSKFSNSRQSFPVDASSGEINPPGWVHGPFGLFYDLNNSRWVLTHLPSRKVFPFRFLAIESACQAVLELEALPVEWSAKRLSGPTRETLRVLEKFAEPEEGFASLKRKLAELLPAPNQSVE